MRKNERTTFHKPEWINNFEIFFGKVIPVSPNLISGINLLIIIPLLILSLKQIGFLPGSRLNILILFFIFCLLDYLDGISARAQNITSRFGKIINNFNNLFLTIILLSFALNSLNGILVVIKISLDVCIFIQIITGKSLLENRLKSATNYLLLLALILLSQEAFTLPKVISITVVLLYLNIFLSFIIFLYNLNIFHKKYIADLLSGSNLLCGLISIYFAYYGLFEISLLFLMLGATFDGFDGAAARKFGSTPWGVYSDDIADAVNYAIAPGIALYFAFNGFEGLIIGSLYIFFTITRLIFFTLNKENSDPNFFSGVPSTIGGIIVLCSLISFRDKPLLTGLFTGIACVQMVSFDTHYRHLGRAITGGQKRYIIGLPILAVLLLLGSLFIDIKFSSTILLIIILGYGFLPVFIHLKKVIHK